VHASVSSGSPWWNAWRQGGDDALAPKPVPGRPRKLTDAPRPQLLNLLLQGARAHGVPTALWTWTRLAAVIRVHFGVRYHPAHVWKILCRLHWRCQVPERQPIPRDQQAITHGQRSTWPAIKKARRLRAHLAFLWLSPHPHAPPDMGASRTDASHPLLLHARSDLGPGRAPRVSQAATPGPLPPLAAHELQGRRCGGLSAHTVAASAGPWHRGVGPRRHTPGSGDRGHTAGPAPIACGGVPGLCARAQSGGAGLE